MLYATPPINTFSLCSITVNSELAHLWIRLLVFTQSKRNGLKKNKKIVFYPVLRPWKGVGLLKKETHAITIKLSTMQSLSSFPAMSSKLRCEENAEQRKMLGTWGNGAETVSTRWGVGTGMKTPASTLKLACPLVAVLTVTCSRGPQPRHHWCVATKAGMPPYATSSTDHKAVWELTELFQEHKNAHSLWSTNIK